MQDTILTVVILCIIVIPPIIMHNSLISKNNQIDNVSSTTDILLKKRWDLVPNLVSVVKGYADHERHLFERIAELRSKSRVAQLEPTQEVDLNNLVTQLIDTVIITVEKYPQLRASENFMHLQRTLFELEEQISAARRAFNASVIDYNNAVQKFPSSIMAGMLGFSKRSLFEIEFMQRTNPDIGKLMKSVE